MKKLLSLVLVLSMALCFIGCAKETETTYVTEDSGIKMEIKLHAKGDAIKRIVQTFTYSLDEYSEEEKAIVAANVEQLADEYENIDGVTYTSNTTDNAISLCFDMDVSKKDTFKNLVEQDLLYVDRKDADYLSLKETKKGLESEGFTEVK